MCGLIYSLLPRGGTSERWIERERERRRKSTVVKVRVQQIVEISKSQGRGVTMSTSKYFPSNYAWDWSLSAGDSSQSLEPQVRSTLCADC